MGPSKVRGSSISTYGLNDVYGGGELQATGSAMIEAHEHRHDLDDWPPIGERMRVAPIEALWTAGLDRSVAWAS